MFDVSVLEALRDKVYARSELTWGDFDGFNRTEMAAICQASEGSADAALKLIRIMLPDWEVHMLGQQSDGKWWTRIDLPLVGNDAGDIVRHSRSESAFDMETAGAALLYAFISAQISITRHPL